MPDKEPQTFRVIIRNRQEVLFDDQVASLTSVNAKGKFDVLYHHANFISLIERYIILRRNGQPDQNMKIANGIMQVEEAATHIYLES